MQLLTVKAAAVIPPLAFAIGAAVSTVTQQPLTVTDVAVIFAGIALLWLGNVIVTNNRSVTQLEVTVAEKLGNGDDALPARINTLTENFARVATMVQTHENALAQLKLDEQRQNDRMDLQDRIIGAKLTR
jgi:hypothetical protein